MAIFTSIGAAIFGAGTFLAGLTAAGLQIAAGIAINLIAKAVSGSGEQQSQAFGVQGTIQAGGDIERSFMVGWGATAGSLVYANEWGDADKTPNAFNTQVICVGDMPVSGLAQVFVNGELVTLGDATGSIGQPVLEYRKDGVDHLWIKFYDGTQTAADTFLTGTVSSSDRPYGSTRVGVGCPYVIATALVKDELFTGFPTYKFALNGVKLYDPSRDSTVGGSGSHRWSTPSTWGGDGDFLPAVQAYNVMRGLTFNGQWFYGLQNLPGARLPVAHWVGQINKCRAQVQGADGLEPTYRSGGEIGINAPISDAIEALLTTCQGRMAETGGTYKIHVGAPDIPVLSITDGQILSTEEQSFTPFFGLADTINGISAKYPSPAEGWNSKVAPPLLRSDLEALDGDRRLMADVSLDLVPYAAQTQRLMKSALEEARRARRHTYVLPPEAWVLEPGDTLEWTSERNGYETKLFRVDGIGDRSNLDVMVDITEVDPSDYDYDHDTEFQPPVDGPLVISRPAPQPIIDWSVEAASIDDDDGVQRRPAIRINWDGAQPDVVGVEFEVRLAATSEVVHRGRTDNPGVGSLLTSQGVVNSTTYGVRGRYIPGSPRDTIWSDWLAVTTDDIRLSALDIYEGAIVADIPQSLTDWKHWASEGARETIAAIQNSTMLSSEQDIANFTDKKTLYREIISKTGAVEAGFQEAILVATGPGSAIGTKIENLYASMGGSTASILVRMGVGATQAGFSARYAIQVTVDGDTYRNVGFFMDVPEDPLLPSRIVLQASQTVIVNNAGAILALFTSEGTLATARIPSLAANKITAGILQSVSGKTFFNLDTGVIRVSS